jgi:hypothetical protein
LSALDFSAAVTRLLSAVDAAEDTGAEFDVAYAMVCIDGALARAAENPLVISAEDEPPKPWSTWVNDRAHSAGVRGASRIDIGHFHDLLSQLSAFARGQARQESNRAQARGAAYAYGGAVAEPTEEPVVYWASPSTPCAPLSMASPSS